MSAPLTRAIGNGLLLAALQITEASAETSCLQVLRDFEKAPHAGLLKPLEVCAESEIGIIADLSQHFLGVAYLQGSIAPKDAKLAAYWCNRSAQQGFAPAQFNLARLYETGQGVARDLKEAFRWYSMAAAQGEPSAQNNLGNMYLDGRGVTQDYRTAFRWYSSAATQGDTAGQENLAMLYYRGQGVDRDLVLAHMWLNIAASEGSESAAQRREEIAQKMTPPQVLMAQERARRCVERRLSDCDR